jgi:hypothetical protein
VDKDDLAAAFVAIAVGELGTREVGTSNRGPRVDEYLRAAGCEPGQPWCAGFVAWCARRLGAQAGADLAWCYSAYCPDLAIWGKSHGVAEKGRAAAGMVMVQYHSELGRYAHTGIVEKVDGSKVTCIEGNTNSSGGRSGVAVMRQVRDLGDRYLYIDWLAVQGPAPAAWPVVFPDGQTIEGVERDGHVYAMVRAWANVLGIRDADCVAKQARIGSHLVDGEAWMRAGRPWCPVRALAAATGLDVRAEGDAVTVFRPKG